MSEQFYTILTNLGKAKIANSGALGTKVNFTKFKVGDGGGTYYNPTEDQTDVKNKVWEGKISSIAINESNPNWIVIETVIPTLVGGFTIREAGIFDDENNLIAIGKYPETYKPIAAEGSSKDLLIRMILEVSNAENVNLKVDPTVILATKKDIQVLEAKIQETNTQLSDLTQDRIYYCGTTSGTNTYTSTNSKITAYTEGLTVRIKIGTASTGASTVNINGLGAKVILDSLGNPITANGLRAGLPYQLCYNGTNFIVLGKGGGGNVTADKMLLGTTATGDSGPVVGNIPSKVAAAITPSTVNQTIAAGQFLSGIQTILGDSNLVANNIVSGKSIFGVTGTAKRSAIGTCIMNAQDMDNFTYYDGSAPLVNREQAVTINNLGFVPRYVILYYSGTDSTSVTMIGSALSISFVLISNTNMTMPRIWNDTKIVANANIIHAPMIYNGVPLARTVTYIAVE